MTRRRIGAGGLGLRSERTGRTSSLYEMSALIDWAEIDRHLAGIYAAAKGEPAWPPVALFCSRSGTPSRM